MNLLCKIFGCEMEDREGGCRRCGTWLYDWPFVHREMAWLSPWYNLVWWFQCNRFWFYHRCDVCGKRLVFTKDDCCSEKCYADWYPF